MLLVENKLTAQQCVPGYIHVCLYSLNVLLVRAKIVITEMFLKQRVVLNSESCPLTGLQTLDVCDISGFCNRSYTCTATKYTQAMHNFQQSVK